MDGYVLGDKKLLLGDIELNEVQTAAVELMKADLRFLYTLIVNQNQVTPSYYDAMGLYFIADPEGNWIEILPQITS